MWRSLLHSLVFFLSPFYFLLLAEAKAIAEAAAKVARKYLQFRTQEWWPGKATVFLQVSKVFTFILALIHFPPLLLLRRLFLISPPTRTPYRLFSFFSSPSPSPSYLLQSPLSLSGCLWLFFCRFSSFSFSSSAKLLPSLPFFQVSWLCRILALVTETFAKFFWFFLNHHSRW